MVTIDFSKKTLAELKQFDANYVGQGKTHLPAYAELTKELSRREEEKDELSVDQSIQCLEIAARNQVCVTYGELAAASEVKWSAKTRSRMTGERGHLDRLLDLCHARRLPLLTAICVNKAGVKSGELEEAALRGFALGAERLGYAFTNAKAFHHKCRDECWAWGRTQAAIPDRR